MTNTDPQPAQITVRCDQCGELHVGDYSHDSQYGGARCYEVVCPTDWLSDYYTLERDETPR